MLFGALSVNSFAQNAAGAPQNDKSIELNAEKATSDLDKIVKLTEAQKSQVLEFNKSMERRKLMVSQLDDARSKQKLMDELNLTQTRTYIQMLTPDQSRKYNEHLEKNKK